MLKSFALSKQYTHIYYITTWNIGFHFDPINIIRYDIYLIYDYIIVQSLSILLSVYFLFIVLIIGRSTTLEWRENPLLESLWTLYPTIIIIFIVFPSIQTLYKITQETPYFFSLKILGHQWYWSYDYRDILNVVFDSYTIPSEIIDLGETRLLDVDNRIILPISLPIQILITSYDVIHSFSLPRVGVKVDCNPGYLNIYKNIFLQPGLYYGLCREICGSAHSQISITCEITTLSLFKSWIKSFL